MPQYEYKCLECHSFFNVVAGYHDEPPTNCLVCGSGQIKKVPQTFTFEMK